MGASISTPRVSNEFGSGRAGWGPKGNIVREDIPITSNAVDAIIAIGAAAAGQPRTVSIQLNNADGSPIAHCQQFDIGVYADAAAVAAAATGGSTGIAVSGGNGIIEATMTTKKLFRARTNAAGLWTGTWTDTAHEVAFLGVMLPTGRTVFSAALTTT